MAATNAKTLVRRASALLLTLCMALSLLALPVANAAEERDLVPESTLAGYKASGGAGTNFGDANKPDNVADEDPSTCWGFGFDAGMYFVADFGKTAQISSIYVECKEEGTPNDQGEYGKYKIEYQGTDDAWVVAEESVVAKPAADGGFTHTFEAPVAAKAVKITITEWYTTVWASIAKLKVMGSIEGDTRTTLIAAGSEWKYYYFTSDTAKNESLGLSWPAELPADWQSADVDTSTWLTGSAPFTGASYSNASAKTKLDVNQTIQLDAVFSTVFDVEGAADITTLTMGLYYDEDPQVYLNGEQVYTATGYNNGLTNVLLTDHKDLLTDGENTLTVYLVNKVNGGGFNFDLSLTADTAPVTLYDEEGKAVIASAASCAPAAWQEGIANPAKMYDGDHSSCSGKNYAEGSTWFEFNFAGEVEINYIYLELKNEGQTSREDGVYGYYKILAPGAEGGFEEIKTGVPIYPGPRHDEKATVPDGMNGYYVKLDSPLKVSKLRVEVEDWFAEQTCWANICEFAAYKELNAHTVTFDNGGEVVATYIIPDGGDLHPLMVPPAPEKDGKTGTWSQGSFEDGVGIEGITGDLKIEAVYPPDPTGDLNGDGTLTIRDVSRLLLHLQNDGVELHETGDINGDQEVSINDVTALLQKLGEVSSDPAV